MKKAMIFLYATWALAVTVRQLVARGQFPPNTSIRLAHAVSLFCAWLCTIPGYTIARAAHWPGDIELRAWLISIAFWLVLYAVSRRTGSARSSADPSTGHGSALSKRRAYEFFEDE